LFTARSEGPVSLIVVNTASISRVVIFMAGRSPSADMSG
jgi:hypothetical protein